MFDNLELKPCPWCGPQIDEGMLYVASDGPPGYFWVRCPGCGCEGPSEDSEQNAAWRWNTRIAPVDKTERQPFKFKDNDDAR